MAMTDPYERTNEHVNPYAAPGADLDAPPIITFEEDQAQCEAIRRDHLTREALIKLLGSFHYLGAVFGFIGFCALTVLALAGMLTFDIRITAVIVAFYGAMTALNAALGYGLRALQPWARWTEAILYGIGVAVSCLAVVGGIAMSNTSVAVLYSGSLIFQGTIFYLLVSQKGTVVFSSHYKEVIARTPHLRYHPGVVVKLAVVVLVMFVAVAILMALSVSPD